MPDAHDWGLLEPLGASRSATSDDSVLSALVDVEAALTRAWATVTGNPSFAAVAVGLDADALDRAALLVGARSGGVPIIPLVTLLRGQAEALLPGSSEWVHRGATSQDILDTALVLVAHRTLPAAREALRSAADRLAALAVAERETLCLARTLTQHAGVTTAGAVIASWIDGAVAAIERLDALALPVQLGGAAGTGESFEVLGGEGATARLRAALAAELGLADPGRAWHAERSPVLAIADAAAAVAAASGRIGRDLALLARSDVAEFALGTGGGSSAMPHKRNPVDAVLLTANGVRAPGLLATVHSAALSYDARPAGEWHAEWQALRGLLALAAESAAALESAAAGLAVDRDAAARNLAAAGDAILAERAQAELTLTVGDVEARRRVREVLDRGEPLAPSLGVDVGPAPVLAASRAIIDDALARLEGIARP